MGAMALFFRANANRGESELSLEKVTAKEINKQRKEMETEFEAKKYTGKFADLFKDAGLYDDEDISDGFLTRGDPLTENTMRVFFTKVCDKFDIPWNPEDRENGKNEFMNWFFKRGSVPGTHAHELMAKVIATLQDKLEKLADPCCLKHQGTYYVAFVKKTGFVVEDISAQYRDRVFGDKKAAEEMKKHVDDENVHIQVDFEKVSIGQEGSDPDGSVRGDKKNRMKEREPRPGGFNPVGPLFATETNKVEDISAQ